ncbi:MAG TPA: RluA family pseudouridine synthase, partial [Brevundimonas sp.]
MSENAQPGEDFEDGGDTLTVTLGPDSRALRLDKALADAVPTLSRARIQALLDAGAIYRDETRLTGGSGKATPGEYLIVLPPLISA